MADHSIERAAGEPLPPSAVAALLERAQRARRNGQPATARALLRALAAQQPDMPQIWLALATVAETRAEQRQALERVLELNPQYEPARRGLARMQAESPASTNGLATQPAQAEPLASAALSASPIGTTQPAAASDALEPAEGVGAAPSLVASEPAEAIPPARWPLYLVIGVSILVVLIAAILLRGREFLAAPQPTLPTAALPGVIIAAPSPAAEPGSATAAVGAAPSELPATTQLKATSAPQPSSTPAPTTQPTASPQPTMRQTLAPGEIVRHGQWYAILIRPQDALVLDGSIGTYQPRGQFVLALVAVGNDGAAPARIPADMFALVDAAGNRYAPLPQISTAFLNSYGRGQHGDLSMEDAIPADGSNKSVPLIFDVPPTARPLYLVVGDSSTGWLVGQ